MPIYDYQCTDCGHSFEELTSFDEQPQCSSCGGEHTQRQFSFGGSEAPEQDEVDACDEHEVEHAAEARSHEEPVAEASPEPVEPARPHTTLRGPDERCWNLEREYESRHATMLVDIAEKSVRVTELMDQIEQLEPLIAENAGLVQQLADLREVHQDLEHTERSLNLQLEQSAAKLEAAGVHADGLRGEIAAAGDLARAERATLETRLRERDHQIQDLAHDLEELASDLESRTAALFKRDEMIQKGDALATHLRDEIRERDRQLADASQREQALQAQLEAKDLEFTKHQESRNELEQALANVESELNSVRSELDRTSGTLENTVKEKSQLKDAWSSATGEVENTRAKFLASVRHLSATKSVIEELAPMLRSLETTLCSSPEPTPESPAATEEPSNG